MNPRQLFLIMIVIVLLDFNLKSQTDTIATDSSSVVSSTAVSSEIHKMNMIKINLLALPLRTFTLQYERVINKFLSVTIAGRYMPNATIPYKNWIYNRFGEDDPEIKESLDNMHLSNFAITPEVRFYVGKKGYGRGFYLAPSYRYAHYSIDNLNYSYYDDDDVENKMNMSGKMNANYGGLMIGAQWTMGKHLCLDWWIFAPFIGVESTNLIGTTSEALSEEDQYDLIQELEDLDIPYTTVTYDVHENGASIQLHGLMAGISAGLALGVRF